MSINELSIPELSDLLTKSISICKSQGDKWAIQKSLFDSIEDKRKPLIAKLMMKFSGSQNLREQMALADHEYEIYLSGLSAARNEYFSSLVQYDNAKLKVEAIRTLISARKEEVKQFKG